MRLSSKVSEILWVNLNGQIKVIEANSMSLKKARINIYVTLLGICHLVSMSYLTT